MLLGIPLEKLLTIASFSIAIGGLVVRIFYPSGPQKENLIVTVIAFLSITTALSLYQAYQREQRIASLAEDIVQLIGNDKKTVDQIVEGLNMPDPALVSESIDYAVNRKLLGHVVITAKEDPGGQYRVRTYYVRSFNVK